MSDKRLKCICTKNQSGVLMNHRVSYSVTSGNHKAQLTIIVKASEMTNPADENELKTKADAKAVIAKQKWVANLSATPLVTTDTSIAGDVTL